MSMYETLMHWLQLHYLELCATVTGFLYIIFTIREKILLWLFGIISSALYVRVFYNASIYAYALLYVYYVIIGFYGWYNWSGRVAGHGEGKEKLAIRRASRTVLYSCLAASVLFAVPVYFLLRRFAPSDAAWMDALLTSGGMVATWMLTQKLIEQWIFWIVIDLLSCSLMIYKGLFPSSALFLAYAILAAKGYFTWKKELAAARPAL